jgi:hypothetical protein
MTALRTSTVLAVACLLLAACGSSGGTRTLDPRTWFSRGDGGVPGATQREVPGVEARLQRIGGSSLTGVVRARESGDLLVVRLELTNLKGGTMHRVVFHANGNCSSPNGFSAGAAWTPPGTREPPSRLLPDVYTNAEGDAILTARLRGVRLGDMEKRSVLVYEGASTTVPQPGVPNNVIGCGVFERATTLFP